VASLPVIFLANTAKSLSTAINPAVYKVDTDAIALKVKQEIAAKEKAKKAVLPVANGMTGSEQIIPEEGMTSIRSFVDGFGSKIKWLNQPSGKPRSCECPNLLQLD
jgi:hypothetical protein